MVLTGQPVARLGGVVLLVGREVEPLVVAPGGLLGIEILDGVAQDVEFEEAVGQERYTAEGEFRAVGVVSALLGPDIGEVLRGGRRAVFARTAAGAAVPVVLRGAPAEVAEVLGCGGQAHPHADAGDVGRGVGGDAPETQLHGHDARRIDRTGHRAGVPRRQRVVRFEERAACGARRDACRGAEVAARLLPALRTARHAVAVVVVGRGAPEVGAEAEAVGEELAAADPAGGYGALPLVEAKLHAGREDPDERVVLLDLATPLLHMGRPRRGLQGEMFGGDDRPGRTERIGVKRRQVEVDPAAAPFRQAGQRHGELLGTLGRRVEMQHAPAERPPVGRDPVAEFIAPQIGEIVAVENPETARSGLDGGDGDRLVDVGHLRQRGMRPPVGIHDAVAEEVALARRAVAVVAAIGPEGFARGIPRGEALIDPVPDEAALQVRPGVDRLPLQVERAGRVAHRMGVLRGADRTVRALLAHAAEPGGRGVLRHDHVGIPLPHGPLVADRAVHARLLAPFQLLVGTVEVVAVARLVAERKDRHAGIVARAQVHVQDTVQVRGVPRAAVAQRAREVIAHAVRLDIGLRIDVEAEAVAQLVEEARQRVVARADGVDVGPAHEPEVLQKQLAREVMARPGVVFVVIDPLELHRLPVYEQDAAERLCGVATPGVGDLEAAEAHVETRILPVHAE